MSTGSQLPTLLLAPLKDTVSSENQNPYNRCLLHCHLVQGYKDGTDRQGKQRQAKQNLLSNNNDAQSITKYGFLVRPDAQVVALRLSLPQ